ncbi:DUF1835 domain-containing protein [Bacillus sp. sid0103]|uniref:DUF1835 domain-containing protein n=1 Tax=Bacillus sp. sid0103 TaxID=2856337 RepID=UPI001C43D290|nr:DUF1835 domain-containing protein [Bacillus sp. sid0103]MBV7509677.1 DUF1835 domain-containing protein [Bacillus sp. sid0103]
MDDELNQVIHKLSCSKAKSLLLHMMYRVKTIKESNDSQEEMIEKLYFLHDRILGVLKNGNHFQREYEAVHIVCGESAAGSLKVGLGRENKIIGFPDFFAVGPIWELHKEVGRNHRYEWLRDHLNYQDDFIEEEYERRFLNTLSEIDAILAQVPIVIWTAENANEQTGVCFLLYLLKEKTNPIYLMNTTIAYQELFNTSEYQYFYFHTGEVMPEKLKAIYQKKLSKPLTVRERSQFEKEWLSLSDSKGVVRIWESNKIKTVNEDYFDEMIVTAAQQLHSKQKEKDFMKSGRIIGEVLGHIDNNVGDAFLEYRLRSLIYKGIFEIKGIPKGMRYYSVKLR